MEEKKIKLYARVGEFGVDTLLTTIFNSEEIQNSDIFLGEGLGDKFAHPQSLYKLFDLNGLHNLKIVKGKILERTEKEKQEELEKQPAQLSNVERVEQQITDLDIRDIVKEQQLTDLDIRLLALEGSVKK